MSFLTQQSRAESLTLSVSREQKEAERSPRAARTLTHPLFVLLKAHKTFRAFAGSLTVDHQAHSSERVKGKWEYLASSKATTTTPTLAFGPIEFWKVLLKSRRVILQSRAGPGDLLHVSFFLTIFTFSFLLLHGRWGLPPPDHLFLFEHLCIYFVSWSALFLVPLMSLVETDIWW